MRITVVATALGLLATTTLAAQESSELTRYEALAREMLAELVAINTTHSSGDNTAAARALEARLLEAGFPEEDVQVLEPAPRKGNLVARLRGADTGLAPILLLARIDVVEADP
ncbi:MAG: peptidase M20, partial [Gemmatimonas sp.]|nr:peptidase M20 [Gemmatimonas sp.]